jgi:hypothetical protein
MSERPARSLARDPYCGEVAHDNLDSWGLLSGRGILGGRGAGNASLKFHPSKAFLQTHRLVSATCCSAGSHRRCRSATVDLNQRCEYPETARHKKLNLGFSANNPEHVKMRIRWAKRTKQIAAQGDSRQREIDSLEVAIWNRILRDITRVQIKRQTNNWPDYFNALRKLMCRVVTDSGSLSAEDKADLTRRLLARISEFEKFW